MTIKITRRFFLIAATSFIAVTLSNGCGSTSSNTASNSAPSTPQNSVLRVGVTPVPAGEILKFVKDNLATQEGLTIEIIEFNDFNQPNLALKDGATDANYFQHIPFMKDFGKQHTMSLVPLNAVHFNPVGAYSKRYKSIAEIPNNATISIPNDVTNASRALRLLADNKLVKVKDNAGELASVKDITDNPKKLKVVEIEAPSLIRSLDDVDLSVITGNFIVQAGMKPNKDALALESADNTPYAVVLATLQGKENDPRIQKLNKLLVDPKVREFIKNKYEGAVVPVF